MRNFRSKIICLILVFLLTIACLSTISIAASQNAFSVGTRFNILLDTSGDATTASSYYGLAGYSSYYSTIPTYQIMRGKFTDGTYRMSSSILFFSGHGNYNNMNFNYNSLGGDYQTGVYYGTDFTDGEGYKYAGLKSYSLANTKLITFAACNTADGLTNLPSVAVTQGAKTAIGWTEEIDAISHTHWLAKYNDYLSQGKTVLAAINYANSFNYVDTDVICYRLYGNPYLTISPASTAMVSTNVENAKAAGDSPLVSSQASNMFLITKNIEQERHVYEAVYEGTSTIENELKKINENFKSKDYYVTERTVEEGTWINYYYKVDDCITLSGYVIYIDSKNKMVIYDNTVTFNEYKSGSNISDDKLEKVSINAIEKIKTKVNKNDRLKVHEVKKVYDINTGEKYIYVIVEHKLAGTDSVMLLSYYEQVE